MKEYRIEAEMAPIARTGIDFFYYSFQNRKQLVSPHIHSAVELLYIVSGEFQIFADDLEFRVREGCTVLFRSNTIHRIIAKSGENTGYYVLKCSPSFIMDLAAPEYRSTYLLRLALNTKGEKTVWSAAESEKCGMKSAFELLMRELGQTGYGSDLAMKVGAASVLLALVRDLLSGEIPEQRSRETGGEEAIRRIYDVTVYINAHYADNITATDCAAMAYMSYSYFSRLFFKITGKSFKEYLNVTRINHAEKALLSSDKSVTEIAANCGFNSVSYFISTFKKMKGVTPLALRNGKAQKA